MKEEDRGLLDALVGLAEGLEEEPCLLAIVIIFLGSLCLVWYSFRHLDRMDQRRTEQFLRATGRQQ